MMVEPLAKKPFLIGGGSGRLVRVLATNAKGDGFHALTFSETEIQGVAQVDPGNSALVLRSGSEIPVALPYEALEQKVYSPNVRTDDGSILDLRAVTGEAAKPKAPANSNQCVASNPSSGASASNPSSRASSPGGKYPDGSIYAGISPDTQKPMYASPADAPLTMTFNGAADCANKLNRENYLGHDDWRVPTKSELNVLFNNRAAIGGFDVSGSNPAGWYWSATPDYLWPAWCQRFSDGAQDYTNKDNHSSVRLVR